MLEHKLSIKILFSVVNICCAKARVVALSNDNVASIAQNHFQGKRP
jgi:hypothetical protein